MFIVMQIVFKAMSWLSYKAAEQVMDPLDANKDKLGKALQGDTCWLACCSHV